MDIFFLHSLSTNNINIIPPPLFLTLKQAHAGTKLNEEVSTLGEKLEHLREKYAKTTIQLDLMTTESMEEKRALMVERNELQSRYDRMVETMQNNEQEYNATKFTTKTLTTNLNVKENVIIELKKKFQNETETWNTTQTELEQQNVHMSTAIGELETRSYAATDEIRNTTLTINTKQTGTLKQCVFSSFEKSIYII